ncbi:serine hydrolase domain-containing protein [Chryseobacterium hagamense]|uniref:Penicillin-binding protein n=1 Tax=Chryseobacterium hagamense TaxID=395935 RepID=A0A511YQG4_9FLAO|nr:serine hydrolase domain-containing protein [Chryseobacterium hagamense]GEN77435.1 penicillin-binding protein [Chryseobacterium hagamense]
MLKKFSLVLFIIGLLSCQQARKETKTVIVDKKKVIDSTITVFERNLLKNQIDSVFKKHQFNGSVAVFKDSVELYRKNQGFSDFRNRVKIDNQTVFAIGSVSKQFTAVLILLQMEQGKLNMEDKVSKYLTEFRNNTYENITIHQLLNHTSGLNVMGEKLRFKSGTDFLYSNDGFNALGKVIEKVTGKPFNENIAALFKKAGMNASFTGTSFKNTEENFAGAYLGSGKGYEKVKDMPARLGSKAIGIPAGGVLSTIEDLHQWNNALYSGKILSTETLRKFEAKSAERHHPIFGKMGYGYGIMSNTGKPEAVFHSGYIKGSPSLNIFYPKTKTSVIVLSNIADEEKGKGFIFRPHAEIKKIADDLENTLSSMDAGEKKQMKM